MSTCSKSVKKHNRNVCSFTGCGRNKARCPTLRFFSFPLNRPEICDLWVQNCANESLETVSKKTLNNKIVCEKHFENNCFSSTLKHRLHASAVPTIFSLQEYEPDPTPTLNGEMYVDMTPGNNVETPQTSDSTADNRSVCRKFHSRKALFLSPRSTNCSTPDYKKLKSTKGRKSTPRKSFSPRQKRLLVKLDSSRKLKRKYQQKVKRLERKPTALSKEMVIEAVKDMLPEKVSSFVCIQLMHTNKDKKPWTEEEKQQTLAMRYKSPALYEQMRSDGFALPSTSTIARWLQAVDLRPGACPEIMKMIRNKVHHMSDWEKNAVILFDEMSIKTSLDYDSKRDMIEGLLDLGEDGRKPYPATHVLLFMARGLTYRWKMPLAYFATNHMVDASMMANLVTKCVHAAQNAGLKVRAVVCDQSSVNRKAAKLLETSKAMPYFKVNEEKVFFMFDFPHVIKCIRNNLLKIKCGNLVGQITYNKTPTFNPEEVMNNAVVGETTILGRTKYVGHVTLKSPTSALHETHAVGVADWAHVQMLYNIDSRAVKSRATKLTQKHIRPNSFEKMSVKLATQVFSLSVSAAMRTAVETGELPSSALDTAYFLEQMNNMFDVMNSHSRFNPNPHKCAIQCSKNSHLQTPLATLLKDIDWVKSLKMANDKIRPPCMEGLEHTLVATKLLWQDIKLEGAKFLLTGRLNQDPIENEFSVARQKCGFERNPSVRMFRQNLRHRIQAALVQPPAGANYEPDEDELLTTMTAETETQTSSSLVCPSATAPFLLEEQEDILTPFSDTEDDENNMETVDNSSASMPSLESCSVRYFTGYGIRTCLRKFNCTDCKNDLLKSQDANENPGEALIRNKEYRDESCSLIYPTNETTEVVDTVLSVLDHMLTTKVHINGLRKAIILKSKRRIFKIHEGWMRCGTECSKHRDFVINKIVTAKLKRTLQSISKDLRQPGGKYGGHWEKIMKLQNK